jgi:hypothetical protein
MLAPNTIPLQYQVTSPLLIGNTKLMLIEGGGGPGDTTLVRDAGGTSVGAIMIASSPNITNVTISNLTFDGNRYGPGLGLNCLLGNNTNTDLDLDFGGPPQGTYTVQWVDFINAPGDALHLGGASNVILSNFGQGGGIGANGSYHPTEPGIQSATRSTAVWIEGTGNGAWYNAISYAGTAAITLNGSTEYAYGNWLIQNRYEMSDTLNGVLQQGGQLVLSPTSTNASVAGNVINGSN